MKEATQRVMKLVENWADGVLISGIIDAEEMILETVKNRRINLQ